MGLFYVSFLSFYPLQPNFPRNKRIGSPTALIFLFLLSGQPNREKSELMAPEPYSNPIKEYEDDDNVAPSHHPSAPLDEVPVDSF